jgi:ATP-dependent Clp protease ATP-binding subunit ClpC
MMPQAASTPAAKHLLDRASIIASEKSTRVSTLHVAAAWMEQGSDGARVLAARGCRPEDVKLATKIHSEDVGTLERIHSRAKRIAAERRAELSPLDIMLAALTDKHTALWSWISQLGCNGTNLAAEIYRACIRPAQSPQRASIQRSQAAQGASPSGPNGVQNSSVIHGASSRSPAALPAAVGNAIANVANSNANKSAATPSQKSASATESARPHSALSAHHNRNGIISSASATGSSPPGALKSAHKQAARAARPPAKTAFDIDPRTFPAVAMFARNLSSDCARGSLEPVVGREREVDRVLDAVGRRDARAALVIGAPGVGKSTFLRAVARKVEARSVLQLRHSDVAAQARGPQGVERARKLVEELVQLGDKVLVAFDPIAPWFFSRDIPDDVIVELRAALSSTKFAWIGTATAEEARKMIEAEPWCERGAQKLLLDEPTGADLCAVVSAYAPLIASHHGVMAEPPVLSFAAELSERYLGGRAQPDRALSVIDLALSRARREGLPALMRDTIATVVAEMGGLPHERVASTDQQRLLALEAVMARKVVGHPHALSRVAHALRRNAVGFRGNRPIGTFLFLGPTGVGKTECAKAIAEALFPGANAMTRFDMAEFAEPHSVARLMGAPPGYVGYHEGGQLTEAVRRKPYQLILLDEIEKAHRDVLESLLAVLDEGRMTDGRGKVADFRNTVIVMTSNLGSEVFDRKPEPAAKRIGFAAVELKEDAPIAHTLTALAERARDSARAAMPPELWNRIDEPVVFSALTRDDVREIAARLLVDSFAKLQRERDIVLSHSDSLIEHLLQSGGFEPTLGARPMKRAIARVVEGPIADAVLRDELRSGDRAIVEVRQGRLEWTLNRSMSATAEGAN